MTMFAGPAGFRLSACALLAALACAAGCSSSSSSSPSSESDASSKAPLSSSSRAGRSQIPGPAPDAPGKRTQPIGTASDPCADRLHELCGPLLYYYAIRQKLPATLDELANVAGPDPRVEFTCPVSGKPYVYNPQGIPRGGGKPGLMILYDPEPSHSGLRWAVVAKEPRNTNQPLVTDVVPAQELLFHDEAR